MTNCLTEPRRARWFLKATALGFAQGLGFWLAFLLLMAALPAGGF